jgi:hemerythrin superfamily protein
MAAQRKTNGIKAMLNRGMQKVADIAAPDDDLNALDLLRAQHRNVDKLFAQIEQARGARKQTLFNQLADELAIHATIEEKIFYPNVKRPSTEELLQESVEEHLEVKRLLADMMELDPEDDEFDAKLSVLQEQVVHHAKEEEEAKLFPKLRAELDPDLLAALAGDMVRLMVELDQEGQPPRTHIPEETTEAAPI